MQSPDTMLYVSPQLTHSSSSPSISDSLRGALSSQLQLPCVQKKPVSKRNIAKLMSSCSKSSTVPTSISSTLGMATAKKLSKMFFEKFLKVMSGEIELKPIPNTD